MRDNAFLKLGRLDRDFEILLKFSDNDNWLDSQSEKKDQDMKCFRLQKIGIV